jgi:hypothetical protein
MTEFAPYVDSMHSRTPLQKDGAKMMCDICRIQKAEYDARIPRSGVWANLCEDCFTVKGCKLGIGLGQKNGGAK